jgi:hypothetical protein
VFVNGRPALRVDDVGIHAVCCAANMWTAQAGSATVFINGKKAHRLNDATKHCGGQGRLIEGSDDVIVGDGGGGGSGSGGSSHNSSSSASGGGAGKSAAAKESSTASGGGGGAGGAAASQQQSQEDQQNNQNNQNNQKQQTPPPQPQKVPCEWTVQWSDGKPLKGFKSKFESPKGAVLDLTPDGQGHFKADGFDKGAPYAVSIIGATTVTGKLQDEDGKPIADAKVTIDRTFGDSIDVTTDAGGNWKLAGFVEEELFDVTITEVKVKAEGKFVDEKGKPLAGVSALATLDSGREVYITSDSDGKWKIEDMMPGEGFVLEVQSLP